MENTFTKGHRTTVSHTLAKRHANHISPCFYSNKRIPVPRGLPCSEGDSSQPVTKLFDFCGTQIVFIISTTDRQWTIS
jgi:hypothetical protein